MEKYGFVCHDTLLAHLCSIIKLHYSVKLAFIFHYICATRLGAPAGGGGIVIAVWEYIRLQVFVVRFAGKACGTVFLDASLAKYRCVLIVFIVAFIDNSCSACTKAGIADLRIATA